MCGDCACEQSKDELTASGSFLSVRVSMKDKLTRRKQRLEVELIQIDSALAALAENPQLEETYGVLRNALRGY